MFTALAHYGVSSLANGEGLREALWRLTVAFRARESRHRVVSGILRALMQLKEAGAQFAPEVRSVLERVAALSQPRMPFVGDNARQAIYVLFEQSRYVRRSHDLEALLEGVLADESTSPSRLSALSRESNSLLPALVRAAHTNRPRVAPLVQTILARLFPGETLGAFEALVGSEVYRVSREANPSFLVALASVDTLDTMLTQVGQVATDSDTVELVVGGGFAHELMRQVTDLANNLVPSGKRITFTYRGRRHVHHLTLCREDGRWVLDSRFPDIHPNAADRLALARYERFDLTPIETPERVYAFACQAKENARDRRIIIVAELTRGPKSQLGGPSMELLSEFGEIYFEAIRVLRDAQSRRERRARSHWNELHVYVRPVINLSGDLIQSLADEYVAATRALGLRAVVLHAKVGHDDANLTDVAFTIRRVGKRIVVDKGAPNTGIVLPMTDYETKVVTCDRLSVNYPYEVVSMLEAQTTQVGAIGGPTRFVEYDLDSEGELVPVDRARGLNTCAVVVGLVSTQTKKYPDGVERVWLGADPTFSMGALSEPECRRVNAAIALADSRNLPIEWLPVSAGAKIAMDSGTENLDWTARVLREIINFTERGGCIHILVDGVNVGAQSYWNAEATMLMHTRGALIMTRRGSMVLTGKKALEYSGGVAAEDERGIGGVERIMGPNGQAQYIAQDLDDAYRILYHYYDLTYVKPGEGGPRRFQTKDDSTRSVLSFPYRAEDGEPFTCIGQIFDPASNPGRKKPFAVRQVMASVVDQDGAHLERFQGLRDGESSVVWDAHVGGTAVTMIGIESRAITRRDRIPMDGPESWTGGTLFPQSSRKVARAINAASGTRPVVVLANLSGFDGSPESLRKLQLEYGAEIGRAVTRFDGRIVFAVIGRYHGGAYVVFSKALNPELRAIALEHTYASVIGGAPAAAVVFPREVRRRANADARVLAIRADLKVAPPEQRPALREKLAKVLDDVVLEKRGDVAAEFDAVHNVQRAVEVGSLDEVVPPADLRPAIVRYLNT